MRKLKIMKLFFCILLVTLTVYGDRIEVENAVDEKVISAVEKGLDFLASQQNENGSWSCKLGYKMNYSYKGEITDHIGVTALACMAMMANGSTSTTGKYKENLKKGIRFVLNNIRNDGYITAHGSRMYEHAFCLAMLSEAAGMDGGIQASNSELIEKLRRAVKITLASQNNEGGWRYQPVPLDADISVTVSILQALRAARNVGISVPIESIEAAMGYVKKSAFYQGRYVKFNYQLNETTRTSYALTAAGVVALLSAGEYDSPLVKGGLEYLMKNKNVVDYRDQFGWGSFHYLYGHYYASQAMYQAGGSYWEPYYNYMKSNLLSKQKSNGSWVDDIGDTYATSMACIILQIPFEYLPILQK